MFVLNGYLYFNVSFLFKCLLVFVYICFRYVSSKKSGESVFCIRLVKQLSVCTKSYMLALFSFRIINNKISLGS